LFPVILTIGPVTITTIGVFAVLSFFLGGFFIWRRAKQEHIEDNDIFDLFFLASFSGLIGARMGYILSHITEFDFSLKSWLDPVTNHGISWFGFLIGFMLGMAWICNRKKWDFWEIADMTVIGLIVSQILLRLGQFFDGSYVGANTNLPWGLPFPGYEGRQHPISLYEIPFLLFLIWLIKYFDKHYRLYKWYCNGRSDAKPGFLWLSYLFFLSIFHIVFDFVFIRKNIFLFVSLRQIELLGILLLAIFWFYRRSGHDFIFKNYTNKNISIKQTELLDKIHNDLDNKETANTTIESQITTKSIDHPNSTIVTSGRRFFRSHK